MSRRIYVASSWRNGWQPNLVSLLRDSGHEVYDFQSPSHQGPSTDATGFLWSEIDLDWQNWDPTQLREGLNHPLAEKGFSTDLGAMEWADTFVLLLPSGRSAHLEAGWAIGRGVPTAIIAARADMGEPELMYKLANHIAPTFGSLLHWLGTL